MIKIAEKEKKNKKQKKIASLWFCEHFDIEAVQNLVIAKVGFDRAKNEPSKVMVLYGLIS